MSTAATTRPDKRFHNARARAALQSVTLYRFEDGRGIERFLVSRWALSRELPDLAAVEAWLDRLEGRKP